MTVHVFPAAVKYHTIRGTVTGRSGASIFVSTGAGAAHIRMGSHTVVQGARSVQVGDHVRARVRLDSSEAALIFVYPHRVVGQRVHLQATVFLYRGGVLVVSAQGRTYHVLVSQQTSIRAGAASASTTLLRPGANVIVYACCMPGILRASSIHVRLPPARAAKHVRVKGTVISRSPSTLTIRTSSSTSTVGVDSHTSWYGGTAAGSNQGVTAGTVLTVFACCAGKRLVAVSVHILHTHARPRTVTIHGQVQSITQTLLRLASSGGVSVLRVDGHTRYAVGASVNSRTGVRVGDMVSVRAVRQGGQWNAVSVHVESLSRAMHTMHGVVLRVGPGSIVMVVKGTQITLVVPVRTSTVLDGHPSSPSNLRGGDRVAVRVQGPIRSSMSAVSIIGRRPIVKALLVRGTVLAARTHGVLVQNDRGGQHLQVQVVGPVRPTLHGVPVANEFLFPGAQVVVSGAMTHGVLVARTLALHLKPEHTSGFVAAISAGRITITRRSGSPSLVLLPHLVSITDAGKHLSETALRADMILKIAGYRAANKMLFAVRIQIAHPKVSIAARIAMVSPAVVVQTSSGVQYHLRFDSSSSIATSRPDVVVRTRDLPLGSRVHIDGQALTHTVILVTRLDLHLRSETVRGKIDGVTATSLLVAGANGPTTIKILTTTTVTQGSHSTQLSDLVAGDDVTVSGYVLGSNVLVATHVVVHRRRTAVDGTVTLVAGQDVTLNTTSGSVHVVLSASTLVSGGPALLAAGLQIHVSGYRRGDGVILAIQVRIRTKRIPSTPRPGG